MYSCQPYRSWFARRRAPFIREPPEAQFDYWFRLNEQNGLRPKHSVYIGLHWPNVLNKGSLGWFPNQAFSQCVTKAQRLYLRVYTEASTEMSKRKPYTQPGVIRYESEAEYPARTTRIVKALRQELGVLQFEVEPQYVTVVDSDRRYVEVSDSFCQLVGYQREELVGKRYDDLTSPNTNHILCGVRECSNVTP